MSYERLCPVVLPGTGTFISHLSAFGRFIVFWVAVSFLFCFFFPPGVVGVSGHTGKTMEFRSIQHVYIGGRLFQIAIRLVLLRYQF